MQNICEGAKISSFRPSVAELAKQIDAITAAVRLYHTTDVLDSWVDERTDEIDSRLLAIAESEITTKNDALTAINKLLEYLSLSSDTIEDKIIGGILRSVRDFVTVRA